jgi:hypothetical protein
MVLLEHDNVVVRSRQQQRCEQACHTPTDDDYVHPDRFLRSGAASLRDSTWALVTPLARKLTWSVPKFQPWSRRNSN